LLQRLLFFSEHLWILVGRLNKDEHHKRLLILRQKIIAVGILPLSQEELEDKLWSQRYAPEN